MICFDCNKNSTQVIDTRLDKCYNVRRRRYECKECGLRFSTYEDIVGPLVYFGDYSSVRRNKIQEITAHNNGLSIEILQCYQKDLKIKTMERISKRCRRIKW